MLWIDRQVQLLLENRFSELDIENLVEELDGMKKHLQRKMQSRLRVLIMHLLKCQFQKDHPQNKWRSTLVEQRTRLSLLFEESPSLRGKLQQFAEQSHPIAARRAALETGLDVKAFPDELPYSISQILDLDCTP